VIKEKSKGASDSRRIEIIVLSFSAFMAVIAFKLIWLQVVQYGFYNKFASRIHTTTAKMQYGRGAIYDRNGRELAISLRYESICANPIAVRSKDVTASYLAAKLGISRHEVLQKLKKRSGFVYIKRKVKPEVAGEILDRKLPGIYSESEEQRFYPMKQLAAHVVGFAGMDNTGLDGVEKDYEKYLKGKRGSVVVYRDAKRRAISTRTKAGKGDTGADIYLTIDSSIQYSAEKELSEIAQKWNAKAGSVIVMNPNTGEIYAMANYPSYDPNNFEAYSDWVRKNRAITDIYEPGSTFKAFTMSAYINKFPLNWQREYDCENGKYVMKYRTVNDHEPYGVLDVPSIMKVSSNIGFVKMAERMNDPGALYREYVRYGFGRKTGIDLSGENAGLLRTVDKWSAVSIAAVPYGQEIAATSIQLIKAYAALANGGREVTPYVVMKAQRNGSTVFSHNGKIGGRVVGNSTREKVVKMLEAVCEKDGTGFNAQIPGYKVAGKTGTAQKHNENGRGYKPGAYVGSFIGFFPSDKPQVVTLVMLDEPKVVYYGGEIAAPIFRKVSTYAISQMKLLPDEKAMNAYAEASGREPVSNTLPDLRKKTINEASALVKNSGGIIRVIGRGNIISRQEPKPGTKLASGQKVYVYFEKSGTDSSQAVYMPNLRGLSIRKAVTILKEMGLEADCVGSGIAVSQVPGPGTAMKRGSRCTVTFVQQGGSL